jgi:palmitoyl-protein thioesterase
VWSSTVQSRLVPAQYFRSPDYEEYQKYLAYSNFLADINNERAVKNTTYAKHIASLSNFVMYLFSEDTTVVPKESSWFMEVNATTVTPLRERPIYTEDWIGLKRLDQKGGLRFEVSEGRHMELDEALLREAFGKYFGPKNRKFDREDNAQPDVPVLRAAEDL